MSSDGEARLRFTEDWYRQLADDAETAEREMIDLLAGHEQQLSALRGRVLDVGGGLGPAARHLDRSVDYWVVDPSAVWKEPALDRLGRKVRQDGPSPHFVEGVGEQLPFPEADFDAVIAFYSLNHAARPYDCVIEIKRVLRPGGSAYLVLEDMEPSWGELAGHTAKRIGARFGREHRPTVGCPRLWIAYPAKLLGKWPTSPDHVPIDESQLMQAAAPELKLGDRRWIRGFLTLTFRRAKDAR